MNEETRERLEELLAVEALGGLDDAGRRELDDLLATGDVPAEDLRERRQEYAESAAALAMSLPPEDVDDAIVSRILSQPQGDMDLIAEDGGYGDAEDPADELARMREKRAPSRGFRIVAGIVAASVLFVLGGVGGALLRMQASDSSALEKFLAQPGTTVTAFDAEAGGSLNMAASATSDEMYLFGEGVPPTPDGDVYQLWAITGEDAPVPGPTFETTADGLVVAHVEMPHQGVDAVAITVEPPGGSSAPTSNPVYVASMGTR